METGQGTETGQQTGGERQVSPPPGDSWRDIYLASEPELQQDPTLATIKDIPSLAKLAVEARRTIGRFSTEKGILRPKEGAPPEEWDKFYQSLGRPDKPDGYEIAAPAQLPEGFPYAPELEQAFRQWAFEEGLSAGQAKNLYEKYLKLNLENYESSQNESQAKTAEITGALKKEWGDNYPENLAVAQQAMREFFPQGSPGLAALDRVMGDDPDLIRMAYNIGARMQEAGLVKGGSAVAASLEAKKQELSVHPAFLDETHAEHKRVVEEFNVVLKQIVEQEEAMQK